MSGMPLNIDIQQIFLHLFNFTILFAALYFLLYQPVKSFMEKRSNYYDDLDRQSREKLEEAKQVRVDYEQKLTDADEEIRQRMEQAQKEAMDAAQAQIQDAKEQAAHILAKARAEAQAEQERTLAEARKEIADMVTAAAEKLILADTSAAYDQFLAAAGKDDADA